MTSALVNLANIGKTLFFKILGGVAIIGVAIGLFYLIQQIKKWTKKQKEFTFVVPVIDRNGNITYEKMAMTISEQTGMAEMIFKKKDPQLDSIPPVPLEVIFDNKFILYKYAPSQYAPLNIREIMKKDLDNFEIVVFNNNMKNFYALKQRGLINYENEKKDKKDKWLPYLILAGAIVLSAIVITLMVILGSKFYLAALSKRIAECSALT